MPCSFFLLSYTKEVVYILLVTFMVFCYLFMLTVFGFKSWVTALLLYKWRLGDNKNNNCGAEGDKMPERAITLWCMMNLYTIYKRETIDKKENNIYVLFTVML